MKRQSPIVLGKWQGAEFIQNDHAHLHVAVCQFALVAGNLFPLK
jgi:hypothetical protein